MKLLLTATVVCSLFQSTGAQDTIVDIASSLDMFSTLVTALGLTGLDQILAVPWYCDPHRVGSWNVHLARSWGHCREYTVFAPNNNAFAKLDSTALPVATLIEPNYLPLLTDILKYHIVASTAITSGQVRNNGSVKAGNGDFLSTSTNPIRINGINVIEPFDVIASNGVIHTVESVLLPPSAMRSIVDIAVGNPAFSTLVEAVTKAGLAQVLSDPSNGVWTVFAPTNDAFDAAFSALGISGLDDLDVETLQDILLYHVIDDAVVTAEQVTTGPIRTANVGASIQAHVSNIRGHGRRITLNGNIHVTQTNILANNGIVHVIDGVLVPP